MTHLVHDQNGENGSLIIDLWFKRELSTSNTRKEKKTQLHLLHKI